MTLAETLRLIPGYDAFSTAGDCWLDEQAATDAIGFFSDHITHVEGKLARQKFILEPWQQAIVGNVFGWKRKNGSRRYREVMVYVPRKNGKGLALDTPLPTPSGWTTMGQVAVGDVLFDDGGLPCTVTYVAEDRRIDCYAVTFSNGERIVCDGDHLWVTTAKRGNVPVNRKGCPRGQRHVSFTDARSVREIRDTLMAGRDRNHTVAMPEPLCLDAVPTPIDPYVLGVWLGDGSSDSATVSSGRNDCGWMVEELERCGLLVTCRDKRTAAMLQLRHGRVDLFGESQPESRQSGNNLQIVLRRMNLIGNKHIPPSYLRGSISQRLALLQGLMDTDGTATPDGKIINFDTTSEQLRDGMTDLLAGLGVKFTVRQRTMRCNGRDVPGCSWRFQFCVFRDELPVFRMPRKLARMRCKPDKRSRCRTLKITNVEPIETVTTRCIRVDSPSHQFLCGRSMIPTHNTPTGAGIANYVLFCDQEIGQQNYVAASDREQASMLFRQARGMVENNPNMLKRCKIFGGNAQGGQSRSIVIEEESSFLKVISADAPGKHGGTSHLVMIDELHAQPNRELVDVLQTSLTSENRINPLMMYFTTADFDRESICNEKYDYACKVRDGVIDDPSFLPVIYEAALDADWTSPETWAKANPNLGVSVSYAALERECKRAQETPAYENTFKRLHLNIKTQQDVRWIPIELWDSCQVEYAAADLRNRECFGGLDLGSTGDLTAFVLVFPNDDGSAYTLPYFWVPEESAPKRERKDRVPYPQWIRDEYILPTPGAVTDYDTVRRDINQLANEFAIQKIAVDRLFQGAQLCTDLGEKDGLELVAFGQGFMSMAAPTKTLDEMLRAGKLKHNGNPVMRWMANNVAVEVDAAGNMKPSKKKSTERIDGVVSLVMGIALSTEYVRYSTVYNEKGSLSL